MQKIDLLSQFDATASETLLAFHDKVPVKTTARRNLSTFTQAHCNLHMQFTTYVCNFVAKETKSKETKRQTSGQPAARKFISITRFTLLDKMLRFCKHVIQYTI